MGCIEKYIHNVGYKHLSPIYLPTILFETSIKIFIYLLDDDAFANKLSPQHSVCTRKSSSNTNLKENINSTSRSRNSSSPDPKNETEPVFRISVPFRNNPVLKKSS